MITDPRRRRRWVVEAAWGLEAGIVSAAVLAGYWSVIWPVVASHLGDYYGGPFVRAFLWHQYTFWVSYGGPWPWQAVTDIATLHGLAWWAVAWAGTWGLSWTVRHRVGRHKGRDGRWGGIH